MSEAFWALAEQDIREACDLFRPIWDEGLGRDGYVSLEVDPRLAYDSLGTFNEAIRLHKDVDRPNLLVKIPATKPGLAAIEDVIAKGHSVNITLIFSLKRYAEVAESYIRGLERLVAEGGDPSKVASVASFFVSRIDTEGDRLLDELKSAHPTPDKLDDLKGRLAIANAKLAYRHYQQTFQGQRWDVPRGQGRDAAAGAVGLDLDQEPGLPGHALHRRADRPGHGQHDARGDDPGLPGPRHAARDAGRGPGRGAGGARRAGHAPASTTTS